MNDGKKLEDEIHRVLLQYCSLRQGLVHAFVDSRAAQRVVASQPGDFLWLLPTSAVLLECKSTEAGAHLKQLLGSRTSRRQLGKHRLWHRAGHPSLYAYYDYLGDVFQLWDGWVVLAMDTEGRRGKEPAMSGTWADIYTIMEEVAQRWV